MWQSHHISCIVGEWQCPAFVSGRGSHHITSNNQFVSHTGLVMYHLPCSLTTSHPMTNSLWVKWPYCLPASLISWRIGSEWLNPFFLLSQASYDSYPMTNSKWVTQPCFMPGSLITSWPTVCEWHSPIFWPCSLIISHCQQFVSDRHYPVFLPHLIQWQIESECQGCPHFCHVVTSHDNSLWENCFFSSRLSLQISSHDQQEVSNTVLYLFMPESYCTPSYDEQEVSDTAPFFVMESHYISFAHTVCEWCHPFVLPCNLVSPIPWPTGCQCHSHFSASSHIIHDQQAVRTFTSFCKAVHQTFCLDQQEVSDTQAPFSARYLMPWPTASECHCLFLPRQLHNMTHREWVTWPYFSASLFTPHPIMNSKWVTLASPFFFPAVSLHLLWPSACETLPFFLTYSFITDLIPWPTVCEWHYHFSARYSFHQWPTGSVWHCPVWLQGTSHLTNRKWVMLPCKLQSHHISSHDHIVCEWHYIFSLPGSLTIHHAMTNSLWATLWCILFWQTVSHTMTISLLVTLLLSSVIAFPSHLIPWSTESALGAYSFKIPSLIILYAMTNSGSEWYCHFAMQSHYIRPTVCEWHCLLFPSNLISSHSMTNSLWVTLPFFLQGLITYCAMTNSKWVPLPGSLIMSHPMMNSLKWVIQSFFLPGSIIIPCIVMNRKWVTLHFLPCSLITSHPMTNSLWVMLAHFSRQSHHISFCDQKHVSNLSTPFFCQAVSCHALCCHNW